MQTAKALRTSAEPVTGPKIRSEITQPERYLHLHAETKSLLPKGVEINSLGLVAYVDQHAESTAALTTCRYIEVTTPGGGLRIRQISHEVTFNTHLLEQLSDDAIVWIMAHEYAHMYLNEHKGPEESQQRESEADALALEWGYGRYFAAYNREAEDV